MKLLLSTKILDKLLTVSVEKESFSTSKYHKISLYKKLEKELHEKRKEMANIIETANTAYEDRDKANDLIQNLK